MYKNIFNVSESKKKTKTKKEINYNWLHIIVHITLKQSQKARQLWDAVKSLLLTLPTGGREWAVIILSLSLCFAQMPAFNKA